MKGFQKSTIIYNFNNVSKLLDEGECDIIMLTEGFSDVWRAFSHGFLKCAAIMGKEATQQQIDLLLKHTYRVCLAFDRDRAGEEGMKSFWDKTKNLVEIEWLKIPKGKDLGSLSKNEFWELYNGRVKV
jgi:DNA primase